MDLVKSKGGNIALNILIIFAVTAIAVSVVLTMVKIKGDKLTLGLKKG